MKMTDATMPAASSEKQPVLHQYHCPLDGEQLIEVGFGLLLCRRCETQFVPTLGPWEGEAGLAWMQKGYGNLTGIPRRDEADDSEG
jgi:hypothetical protein